MASNTWRGVKFVEAVKVLIKLNPHWVATNFNVWIASTMLTLCVHCRFLLPKGLNRKVGAISCSQRTTTWSLFFVFCKQSKYLSGTLIA
jgi:hypothetical protein